MVLSFQESVREPVPQTVAGTRARDAQGQSVRHRRTLLALPLAAEVDARYTRMAEESLAAQRQIEAQDTLPFEIFRQQYLSPDMLSA